MIVSFRTPFLITLLLCTAAESFALINRKHLDFTKLHTDQLHFPKDFIFGFAIAEQQNSGAENLTDSNWSHWEEGVFADGNPHIVDNQRSGKACDHWNLYQTDIDLMKNDFNANGFRFSLAWDRIEPQEGNFCEDALEHYSDEVDALLKAGITPMITLHHFAHPQWFEEKGGFEKEENIAYFIRYAKKVFEKLGDRIPLWCTINEPTIYVFQGYLGFNCVFPPCRATGMFSSYPLAVKVLRNLLQAHTEVYKALKAMPHGKKAQIGLVHQYLKFHSWTCFNPLEAFPAYMLNELLVDSVINFLKTGTFSYKWIGYFKEKYVAPVEESDRTVASQISDFVGLNYYSRVLIEFSFTRIFTGGRIMDSSPNLGETATDHKYAIYPEGIYKALHHVATIGLPIYITENGIADHTITNDHRRVRWIKEYLKAVSLAIEDGIDVRGYFYWTLVDNFEWDGGYNYHFGIYSNDRTTQKRTLKDGGKAYASIVKASRAGQLTAPTADNITAVA